MIRPLIGLVALSILGCDAQPGGDEPPIVVVPDDSDVPDMSDGSVPDMADMMPPPVDAAPPVDVGPACVDPCDDGDPTTTGDRCVDDLCRGEALPPMLVRVGDSPLAGEEASAPGGALLEITPGDELLEQTRVADHVPNGYITPRGDGFWLARPLAGLRRTHVSLWRGGEFVEVARAPLVPDARVWQTVQGTWILAAPTAGPVVHVDAEGRSHHLGPGLADGSGFMGIVDGRFEARALSPALGDPWIVDETAPMSMDGAKVSHGVGLLPTDEGLTIVDIVGERVASVEFGGPVESAGSWLYERAGDRIVDLTTWPPSVRRLEFTWADARWLNGGLLAVGADGAVSWVPLGEPAVERGTVAEGARIAAVHPRGTGAVVEGAESRWWVEAGGEPSLLPAMDGAIAALHDRWLFTANDVRVSAIDLTTGELQLLDGAFGAPVTAVDGSLLIRSGVLGPAWLGRLDADGFTPLSTVWTPAPRALDDDVEWARRGGETAVLVAEADGPLVALDLTADAPEPVSVARLRFGTRWAIGGVTGDGQWAVWRAGDAVLGSLRAGRVDGAHFPDGIELLRGRANPVLMAPTGSRLTVGTSPAPFAGFPILDPASDAPDTPPWVVVEGTGVFPLSWIDGETLLVGICRGEQQCDAFGLGRVDMAGPTPVFAPLVAATGSMVEPVWGETVAVADGVVYYTRRISLFELEVRRIALDGRGPWSIVARGLQPIDMIGSLHGGQWFSLVDAETRAPQVWYAERTGDGVPLDMPGGLVDGLSGGRSVVGVFEAGAGGPCVDCGSWRLDVEGAPPTRIGAGLMRPIGVSPDGEAIVHEVLVDGAVGLSISTDGPGRVEPMPAMDQGDLRFMGWVSGE